MNEPRTSAGSERTLEQLLKAEEIEGALIFKGHWTEAERRIALEAWQAGLELSRDRYQRENAQLRELNEGAVGEIHLLREALERYANEAPGWLKHIAQKALADA